MWKFPRVAPFFQDEDGPTTVEYAVMLACILIACLAAVAAVGTQTRNLWNNNTTELGKAFSTGMGS